MDTQSLWLTPPESLILHNNEVHVWRSSLEILPSRVKTLKQMLSADELNKADRFHFRKDSDYFVAARGFLRSILSQYLGIEPGEIIFSYGPYGKPELAEGINEKSVRFNVAHSHGLAIYAVARGHNIGVDLEYLSPDLVVEDIMEQCLTPREIVLLKAHPHHIRQRVFFTYWTRKEACLKALGVGLALDLNRVEFLATGVESLTIRDIYEKYRKASLWTLKDLDTGLGYAAALAIEGHGFHLKCWQWEHKSSDVPKN
jgi:4'-phosphopantetheinyl transferase